MSQVVKTIGFTKIILYAEDVDSPGTMRAVQGMYDDNNNFVLLTNGTGGTTTTDYGNLLLEDGTDSLLTEGGNFLTQQA